MLHRRRSIHRLAFIRAAMEEAQIHIQSQIEGIPSVAIKPQQIVRELGRARFYAEELEKSYASKNHP